MIFRIEYQYINVSVVDISAMVTVPIHRGTYTELDAHGRDYLCGKNFNPFLKESLDNQQWSDLNTLHFSLFIMYTNTYILSLSFVFLYFILTNLSDKSRVKLGGSQRNHRYGSDYKH